MGEVIVTTVKGQKITVRDVLTHMKIKGIYRSSIYEIIESKVIEFKLDEIAHNTPADEIASRVSEKRILLGLGRDADLDRYLKYHGIAADQLHNFWAVQVKREILKKSVITDEQIKKHYRANKDKYVTASVARIAFRSRDIAEQMIKNIENGSSEFYRVAKEYSIDESTKFGGGYLGNIRKGFLSYEIEEKVFSAKPESVIGPFQENNVFTIYKIYSLTGHNLDKNIKTMIKDQLFEEWMRKVVCSFPA